MKSHGWELPPEVVTAWTVNNPEAARGLSDRGVAGLITDRPGRLVHAVSPQLLTTA